MYLLVNGQFGYVENNFDFILVTALDKKKRL